MPKTIHKIHGVENDKMFAWLKSRQDILVIIASVVIITNSIICATMVGTKFRQTQMMTQVSYGNNFDQGQTLSTSKSFDWCLPCDVLANRSTPILLENLNKTLVGDAQHCCAYTEDQATLLLELMSSTAGTTAVREVPKTFDAGNFALSKASAHQHFTVTQFYGVTEFQFPEENVILEFEKTEQDPLIDHARHITLTQSAMVVQLPGQYYIYSSIFFKPDSSQPCKDLPKQIWEHNILLSRREGTTDEIIFNTTYTCCDTCVQHKKTSYTGGLFDLKENDRLRVEVSSVGVVSFRKEGSYFGLFMVE